MDASFICICSHLGDAHLDNDTSSVELEEQTTTSSNLQVIMIFLNADALTAGLADGLFFEMALATASLLRNLPGR